ncbi:MAG: hypothetical protein KAZ87_10160 [Spirochaetes bacterium]|nr:hypothetical protein [Spirochaetota bacterium]
MKKSDIKKKYYILDPIVESYWEEVRDMYSKPHMSHYVSYDDLYREYEEGVKRKQGLCIGSDFLIYNTIKFLSAELKEYALVNAKIAKLTAETAIKIGDFGQYNAGANDPMEKGYYKNLENAEIAEWILTGNSKHEELINCLIMLRNTYGDFTRKCSKEDKIGSIYMWILPSILFGDIEEGRRNYDLLVDTSKFDVEKIEYNGRDIIKTAFVLFEYLEGKDNLHEIASATMEEYFYNMTGWGREGSKPRDRIWYDITPKWALCVARIRAKYFTGEIDPINITQSLRYMYDCMRPIKNDL